MEYTHAGGYRISPTCGETSLETARRHVRSEVVPEIPSDTYQTTSDYLPLKYDTSPATIVNCVLPHADGSLRSDAVYVLECFRNQHARNIAINRGVSTQSIGQWDEAQNARRILYVGVTSSVVRRIDQHLNSPADAGAFFTGVFRPVRILNVDWHHSYEFAETVERVTAEVLREEFPEDFVAYPG